MPEGFNTETNVVFPLQEMRQTPANSVLKIQRRMRHLPPFALPWSCLTTFHQKNALLLKYPGEISVKKCALCVGNEGGVTGKVEQVNAYVRRFVADWVGHQ